MSQVVDYSWGRVGGSDASHAAAVAAAGYVGAMRYLCHPADGIKRLTKGELDVLHAAGLAVGVVWETTADRAGRGRDAGRADAVEANRQMDALGFPVDRPCYYAVDFDASPAQVAPYFDGVAAVGGRDWGVYGSYRIVEGLAARTDWLWQCAAWSGNGAGSGGSIQGRRLSRRARLFQRVGYVLNDTCDVNDVLSDDWGGWHPDHPTTPPEDEVTPEQMNQLGTWMQEQAANVVNLVNRRIDALAWGIVAGNVKVLEAINKAQAGGGQIDVDAVAAEVSTAVADELAKRMQD